MAADELEELLGFLTDKRANVKQTALDILLGLTGSPEGIDRLKKGNIAKTLMLTLRLVCDEQPEAAKAALSILVNLSNDEEVVQHMLNVNTVGRSMDFLREGACKQPKLLVGGHSCMRFLH